MLSTARLLSRTITTTKPTAGRLLPVTSRFFYQQPQQRTFQTSIHHPVTKPSDDTAAIDEKDETNTTNSTATAEKKQGRANEIIEAVLYGSKKIKEEERQTHSKVLARGKYVHELQSKYKWRGFICCLLF